MDRINYYLVFIGIFLLFGLGSCSKRMYPTGDGGPIFFPPPPDTARIQFLTRFSNSLDIEESQSKFATFVAGEQESSSIIKPLGMHIHEGKMYICDPGLGGLEIIDLKNKTFSYFIPGGRQSIGMPRNCFVDEEGTLFVCDQKGTKIVVFNKNLEFVSSFGGTNFLPTDIFITGDTILATNPINHQINVYSKTSQELLFSFPKAEQGDEEFLSNPLNVFMEGDKIYVTDFGHFRIKIFNRKGEYLSSVGSYGKSVGQFVRPKGIAVDREQNLFVVDGGFENIQIFNKDNRLLTFFGGPYKSLGDMYLPVDVIVDYDNLVYFEKYVDPAYKLKYLIFVVNQFGPDKITVYGRIEPK